MHVHLLWQSTEAINTYQSILHSKWLTKWAYLTCWQSFSRAVRLYEALIHTLKKGSLSNLQMNPCRWGFRLSLYQFNVERLLWWWLSLLLSCVMIHFRAVCGSRCAIFSYEFVLLADCLWQERRSLVVCELATDDDNSFPVELKPEQISHLNRLPTDERILPISCATPLMRLVPAENAWMLPPPLVEAEITRTDVLGN